MSTADTAPGVSPKTQPVEAHRGSVIDCDVHITVPATQALLPYFDDYWAAMIRQRGIDKLPLTITSHPLNIAANGRPDWRPAHAKPGTSLELLREQALEGFGARLAICNCVDAAQVMHGEDLAAAFCRAVNAWIAHEWLDKEPRLRASMVVPVQNPDLAAKEIERLAPDRRFVQVLLPASAEMPLGRRYYWPIYAAAERHGLTVGIHAGSTYRHPPTPTGWPASFLGDYVANSSIAESQLLSLIAEGVFAKFPGLKAVFIETGFLWYPAFIWRADKTWRGVRAEIPWVKVPPSEVVQEHVRFTLQPVDAPPEPRQLERALQHLGSDRLLLFSSDFPHWQFDGNDALPAGFPPEMARKVLIDNPMETYRRLAQEDA